AGDIREVRDRDLRVEFRRVAVPMIGLQTRLVVVGPRRCNQHWRGPPRMAEAGSGGNRGKLRNWAGSIHENSIAYGAIVSPAPGTIHPSTPCAAVRCNHARSSW